MADAMKVSELESLLQRLDSLRSESFSLSVIHEPGLAKDIIQRMRHLVDEYPSMSVFDCRLQAEEEIRQGNRS